jgi:hypothetical protein
VPSSAYNINDVLFVLPTVKGQQSTVNSFFVEEGFSAADDLFIGFHSVHTAAGHGSILSDLVSSPLRVQSPQECLPGNLSSHGRLSNN